MAVSEKSISDKIGISSLAEELKKERENNNLAFNTKYSHKEDLENLLKLAEELKEKCDYTKNKIKKFRYLQIAFLLGSVYLFTAPVYFGYFAFFDEYKSVIITIFTIASIIGFVDILLFNSICKDYKAIYLSDKIALTEVLQLLRETSDIIAELEDWSVLSRAEFRIRLSRFNLEEKSKSAFNFFS